MPLLFNLKWIQSYPVNALMSFLTHFVVINRLELSKLKLNERFQVQSSFRAVFQSSFRTVSEQFQSSFKAVSGQFQNSFSELFQSSFSKQFQSNFRAVSEQFQSSFSKKFQSNFRAVSQQFLRTDPLRK